MNSSIAQSAQTGKGEWSGGETTCAIMQIQRKQKYRQIADKANYRNVYIDIDGDANFYSSIKYLLLFLLLLL